MGGGGRTVDEDEGPAFDEGAINDIAYRLGIADVFADGLVGVERLLPFLSTSEATSATTPSSPSLSLVE